MQKTAATGKSLSRKVDGDAKREPSFFQRALQVAPLKYTNCHAKMSKNPGFIQLGKNCKMHARSGP